MKYKIITAAFVLLCLIPSAGMLFLPPTQAAANERLSPKPTLKNDGRELEHRRARSGDRLYRGSLCAAAGDGHGKRRFADYAAGHVPG